MDDDLIARFLPNLPLALGEVWFFAQQSGGWAWHSGQSAGRSRFPPEVYRVVRLDRYGTGVSASLYSRAYRDGRFGAAASVIGFADGTVWWTDPQPDAVPVHAGEVAQLRAFLLELQHGRC